ncbi:uncharacterized protein LOC34619717 [Cyclospora cayetanensis]|uniref:Uncharacterized protein LOC34619717 n=1 Tax=Cyclospora cayetanensis TaxID=88456 RepID=A0A6P6RTW3_9EIME|nr:uncharacterized protein LOC34619717 [Cyclospora cayetanensis]
MAIKAMPPADDRIINDCHGLAKPINVTIEPHNLERENAPFAVSAPKYEGTARTQRSATENRRQFTLCRPGCLVVLFVNSGITGYDKNLWSIAGLAYVEKAFTYEHAQRILEMDAEPQSFTQGERDMWSGLLDQEYIMQSSRSLVQAFKTASKYIYSTGFVRNLFSKNPWLQFSVSSLEQKLVMVKKLEKIATGSKLRYWNKPRSAAKLLAQHSLSRLFPLRRRIIGPGRRQYQKHFKTLNQALLQARAGTDALELILASKTLPMYSWTDSFYSHPIATLHSTVAQAFEDAVNGVSGLFSNEVKSSCFSFAYRVNSIAPYTAVYPGGILGNIMNGLIRSYLLVFQHSLINFKGIFALLIGVVCKTRIIQAAVTMRGDPIGRGLMDRMFKREAVVLTTILFQLHAVNVEEQYEHADNIKTALSGSGGSWSLAEGLFIGAAEFARAFHSLVIQYTRSADAYVKICKHIENEAHKKDVELQDFSEEGTGDYIPAESRTMQNLADEALEFFPEAHPEASGADEPLNTLQKLELLNKSCRKNSGFVAGYTTRKLYYVKRVIGHMVRVLQYYFKYFKSYIADILSIFYETALAMLETKINDSLGTPEGVTTQAEEMAAAEARHAARKSAAQSAIEDSQLPRKIFRAMKFAKESQNLAHGFYKAAGAFSLLHLAETHEEDDAEATKLVALELLTQGEASMRSGLGTIYERFLNSEVLLSRVVKSKKRLKVFELLAKCHTPLEERSEDAKSVCGKIVTSEIDKDEFIASALFSLNLPISGPLNDIAFYSTGTATRAFELWAQYSAAKGKKNALQIANRNVDNGRNAALIEHLRNEVNEKLTFRRFEVVEHTAKIILYDENGRSLTFTELTAPAHSINGKRIAKPDPLDCTSRFKIKESNHGTLVFYLASGQRAGEKSGTRDPTLAAQRELSPAIELEGKLEYNDERKELSSIQNDPTAIRDTITAHFVEKQGRVTAETISGLLMMLHSRLPIFWKRSPVEFLQNLTPKMFFDALMILSTQAYDQTEATVRLDGKLYSFPKSFTALKDLFLSAVNRAIIRMHSLNASDAALLIAMGSMHFAYKKIQKHRTGRTITMHLFLREVHHIMNILTTSQESLKTLYAECHFLSNWDAPEVEDVLKCALFRFLKIGSLSEISSQKEDIERYANAFVRKLAELKGQVTWLSYLNLDYFNKSAKIYAKTAAKYSYQVLYNQLNDLSGSPEEESELARLMKKLHPSLSGYRPPRPKKKSGFIAMLARFRENIGILPRSVRQKVIDTIRNCVARMRRFLGSRRSWFYRWKISPRVIQGPHFMGALKYAEIATYPDPDSQREVLIEVSDLEEFGKVLLTLETVAATLDSPQAMYNTVTQVRATPAFTPSARQEHESLIERARLLGSAVVKVAAGWVLKTAGAAGVNMALGLLALLDTSGTYIDKALQLQYLTAEALAFLNSSLDLGYLLMHLPEQTPADVKAMRFHMRSKHLGAFAVKAQSEPKGLGVNTADDVTVTDAIRRVEAFLTGISKGMEGSSFYEWCNTLVSRELKGPLTATTSFSSEMLLASDAFGLCFLLLKLRDHAGAGMDTIKIEDILQTVYIDQQPVSEHLKFLQERNADIDERKLRVKYIEKFLQYMLVATIESLGIHLGAINFRSYDGETKVLSFQYTKQEASPPGAPAETLTFAADLLLGTHTQRKQRFVSFAFEGPQFLLEWYRYLMPKKLREFVDAARDNKATVSYAEMRKLSNVYTVTDLADLAYSVRQSSRINAGTVAREAALRVMENEAVPPLTRYGLGHMLVDVVSQAELVKRKCIGKTLDEYDTFRSSPLLERELFKYDCFYTKISESSAFADVANNLNEAHIREVMEAIDTAYEKEAEVLYNKLLNSEVPHTKVAKMAFKSMEEFPIADMADNLLPEFIVWVREKKPWGEVVDALRLQRSTAWTATRKSTTLGRPVTSLEHPMLMNPFQIIIDVILSTLTGTAKRRRFPVLAPLNRLKALYATIKPGRKSLADYNNDLRSRKSLAAEQLDRYMSQFPEEPVEQPLEVNETQ